MLLTIYVPKPGTYMPMVKGSALVSLDQPDVDNRVIADYEGGLYQDSMPYDVKLMHAADRHIRRYPTVARAAFDCDDLIPVGVYNTHTWSYTIDDQAALDAWLAP